MDLLTSRIQCLLNAGLISQELADELTDLIPLTSGGLESQNNQFNTMLLLQLINNNPIGDLLLNMQLTLDSIATSLSSIAVYDAGNITGATSINFANGAFQKATMTRSVTLNVTGGSPSYGSSIELWIEGNGDGLSMHGDIIIPSDSLIVFPKTMNNGEVYILKLKYNGSDWMLVSLVGGF